MRPLSPETKQAAFSLPPALKASASARRGGRTVRPRFGPAIADPAACSTAGPSRWTHLVGVTGRAYDRHPHLGMPSDLARLSAAASSVAIGDLSPWRSLLPPLRVEGTCLRHRGRRRGGDRGACAATESCGLRRAGGGGGRLPAQARADLGRQAGEA